MYKRVSSFLQRTRSTAKRLSSFSKMSMRLGRLGQHAKRKKEAILETKKEQAAKLDRLAAKNEIRDQGLRAIVKRDFKSFDEYASALLNDQSLASTHGIAAKAPTIPKKPTVKKMPNPKGRRRK